MKKALALCTLLAVLCSMALAGKNIPTTALSKAASADTKVEYLSVLDQIRDAKRAGLEPAAELYARLEQLRPAARGGHALDQGSEAWAGATVIPNTFPYNDTGTLGATDDCVGRPYNDVFYIMTVVDAGAYTFDMCGTDGDTYLKLWKTPTGDCASALSYTSDDVCGMAPSYMLSLVAGDIVVVECGNYSQTGTPGAYFFNVTVSTPPPPGGETCASAMAITDAGSWTNTTCGKGNDYFGTCMSPFDEGEDFIYAWTVATPGDYQMTLTTNASWVGMLLDNECPSVSPCIASATSAGSGVAIPCTNMAAGTYYIMIDTWPSPYCIPSFTLTIVQCGGPVPGEVCASAFPLTVPSTVTGTTVGFVNDYDAVCPYSNGTAPDVVYSYTPAVDQQVTFDLCASSYDTKLYIYQDACTGDPIACNDDNLSCPDFQSRLECVPLLGGHTYFVVVDGYGSDAGSYSLTATECVVVPPPVNDNCADALPIEVNGAQICATTAGATLDCPMLDIPEIWYSFSITECMNIVVSYCGTITGGSLNAVLSSESCCGPLLYYDDFDFVTCADGLISIHFNNLAAGTYWLPVGLDPAGDFCVAVTGTACPPPIQCDCTEPAEGRFCNLEGGPINDASPNSFMIGVGPQYHITDVNVCLDLVHTYDGDLHIYLESPSGTIVNLAMNVGGSGDNFTCTTFDDEATTPIASGTAPFSGSFIPEAPLSGFDGENGSGMWILHIDDLYGGDFGTLNWFCATFQWDYILAAELAGYAAIPGDNSVTLNWATASETNNDHFEIVRGNDVVARVAGHNGASRTDYSWTDATAQNGTVYTYSLIAVDLNGTRKELGSVSATPSINSATVTEYALGQNYPNPFNPTTSIAVDLVDAGFVTLKVYNLVGQQVADLSGTMTAGRHVVNFSAASLSSGVYLYRMNVNGFNAEKKMLLMK